jgi:hypothetical protein
LAGAIRPHGSRLVSPKEGIKAGAGRYYMRRTSEAQTADADMALAMLIVGLVTVIMTALVGWGTPLIFIPMAKGVDDGQRDMRQRK